MTVRIRPLARRDLKRHFRYIHQFNPDAAWSFRDAALATFKQISRHPALGHQMGFRRVAGVRSIVIADYPNYVVFWREQPGHVEIVRILHGMQHLPRFFRRKH